jgi:hypothetical protein
MMPPNEPEAAEAITLPGLESRRHPALPAPLVRRSGPRPTPGLEHLFETPHRSPQPPLWRWGQDEWLPVLRLG